MCNFTRNVWFYTKFTLFCCEAFCVTNLHCFVARQFLSQIYALFSVKFTDLKMCQCKKSDKYEVWMLYTDVIYSYMLYRFYILHQWSLISTINEEPLQSQFTPYFEKGYYIEKNSENDDVIALVMLWWNNAMCWLSKRWRMEMGLRIAVDGQSKKQSIPHTLHCIPLLYNIITVYFSSWRTK